MTYTVWVKVENDDGELRDDDEGWCAIAGDLPTRDAAVDKAEEALKKLDETGVIEGWYPLDGWRQ